MSGVCACVIARDADATLDRCLASLAWCDECVVVVDPRSRDATLLRARAAGARVLEHAYAGNVEQKRFAFAQAKGEWIVSLDADEALSPALATRLRDFLRDADPGCDGVELNRCVHHLGRWIRHGDFHPDWQLRAFRRGRGRVEGRNPHGRVRVPGRVVRLTGDLEHRSYASLADQIERVQGYSRIEAEALHAQGRRARLHHLVLRPPARFLRAYLLRQGFRDGVPGLVIAAVTAFHVFLKYAKLWELQAREAHRKGPRPALAREGGEREDPPRRLRLEVDRTGRADAAARRRPARPRRRGRARLPRGARGRLGPRGPRARHRPGSRTRPRARARRAPVARPERRGAPARATARGSLRRGARVAHPRPRARLARGRAHGSPTAPGEVLGERRADRWLALEPLAARLRHGRARAALAGRGARGAALRAGRRRRGGLRCGRPGSLPAGRAGPGRARAPRSRRAGRGDRRGGARAAAPALRPPPRRVPCARRAASGRPPARGRARDAAR